MEWWWLFVSPVAVLLLGVRVLRYQGRYRGRHRRDAGVAIFDQGVPVGSLWWIDR